MTDVNDHDYIPVNTPEFRGNEIRYLKECIETGWISSEGQFVGELEVQLAHYVGREHGIAVSSGSAGLDVAISALGIGPGDEVIVPTFTIISCVSAIVRAGALPVLVDLNPETWTMDIDQINSRITSKTKAMYQLFAGRRSLRVFVEAHTGILQIFGCAHPSIQFN